MGIRFAALFGETGTKDFRTRKAAEAFAKKKVLSKRFRSVDVDRIITNPRAKPGEIDFSQRTVKQFKSTTTPKKDSKFVKFVKVPKRRRR